MNDERSIGAVVLNWRDSERTVACVSSLLVEPQVSHVWVVDNESDGSLASLLKDEGRVSVIASPTNLGFSAGMNLGLRQAARSRVPAILCQNNDATLNPGALSAMLSALRASKTIGAVAPRVFLPDGRVQSTGGQFTPVLMRTNDIGRRLDYLTFASVLVRTDVFTTVGFLDERFFMYWEDVEFGLRMKAHGWQLAVAPEASVVHQSGASHIRARDNVARYSTYGLVVLARVRGGAQVWVGVAWRVVRRVGGALLSRNRRAVLSTLDGARLGIMHRGPAAEVFPR